MAVTGRAAGRTKNRWQPSVARSSHIDLGGLKGNIGDQNYAVPRSAGRDGYRTVVIWCQRFSVTFGYAPLARTS